MTDEAPDGIRLIVNGTERRIAGDPKMPLLSALRGELGLAGVRFGCGAGLCGACNVLMEGRVVQSCDTPLRAAEGKTVVTLEGLGTRDRPHPLQTAFLAEQAAQCGYCIPGIIVSAAALLQKTPKPSESEIRTALDGNLCRCGAHNRIVRAVLRAAGEGAPA